jgi:hypothetical protein
MVLRTSSSAKSQKRFDHRQRRRKSIKILLQAHEKKFLAHKTQKAFFSY